MNSSHHDFDFLHGSWSVRHKRLTTRLQGSDDWQEFAGTSTTSPVLGGFGNIEDNQLELPGGAYRAIAIRSYDAATGLWAIWWLDGQSGGSITAARMRLMCQWSDSSEMASAHFWQTMFLAANRSRFDLSGRELMQTIAPGSRRFHRTADKAGKPTG